MMKNLNVLLVEDSPSDAFLTQEALKEVTGVASVSIVSDGVEALEFLRRQDPHAGSPAPNIILLDLNMPRKDGRELLAEIKQDKDLRRIPVVILTSSSADSDLMQAYDLHANCYIVKPVDFKEFRQAIKVIEQFWFHIVALPPR